MAYKQDDNDTARSDLSQGDDGSVLAVKFNTFGIDTSSSDIDSSSYRESYVGSESQSLHICDKKFPPELHKTLLEFVLSFLIEKPADVIDYAVKHFTMIQQKRRIYAAAVPEGIADDGSGLPVGIKTRDLASRRKSVFAESYDPDEEEEEAYEFVEKSPAQLERLWNSIKDIVIFRSLDMEERDHILNAMFEKRVGEDQIIIRQGEDGDFFYVIESGKFKAVKDGEDVFFYNNAGIFGELALLYNTKRAASVVALTNGLLWALDRATFRRILISGAFKKRKIYNELLQSVPMFSVLTNYERMKVADALVTKFFQKNDIIMKQGDAGDGMYFLEDGRVSVYKDRNDNKGEICVSKLHKGQYFGELALLTHDPRRATVRADCEVKTAFLDKDSFERLLGKCIDILNREIVDYNLKDAKLIEYLSVSISKMKHINDDEPQDDDSK